MTYNYMQHKNAQFSARYTTEAGEVKEKTTLPCLFYFFSTVTYRGRRDADYAVVIGSRDLFFKEQK